MTKEEQLPVKSHFNATLVGVVAGVQSMLEDRKTLTEETGKKWHTEGDAYQTLLDVLHTLEELPTYGKGAAFERNATVEAPAAPAVVAPVAPVAVAAPVVEDFKERAARKYFSFPE